MTHYIAFLVSSRPDPPPPPRPGTRDPERQHGTNPKPSPEIRDKPEPGTRNLSRNSDPASLVPGFRQQPRQRQEPQPGPGTRNPKPGTTQDGPGHPWCKKPISPKDFGTIYSKPHSQSLRPYKPPNPSFPRPESSNSSHETLQRGHVV